MNEQDQAPEATETAPAEADQSTDTDAEAGDQVRGAQVDAGEDDQEVLIDTHVAADEPDLDGDGQPG